MKILIATFYTLPGSSGGWTTPIDLLGKDNNVTYLVDKGNGGHEVIENIDVYSSQIRLPYFAKDGFFHEIARWTNIRLFTRQLKLLVEKNSFDCLFCLDLTAAYCAQKLGYRYILRLHDEPTDRELYNEVKKNAIMVTSVDPQLTDAFYIPHGIDIDRFTYNDFKKAEKAILVATLNNATTPLVFVEGVKNSKIRGSIYGSGELQNEVVRACEKTDGKVCFEGPVNRLQLNEVYSRYQIGVACLNRNKNPYVMKISEYQACGLYPIIQEKCHLAKYAPHLCTIFKTADQLTEKINWVYDNWEDFNDIRLQNRKYVEENYDTNKIRVKFLGILIDLHNTGKLVIS